MFVRRHTAKVVELLARVQQFVVPLHQTIFPSLPGRAACCTVHSDGSGTSACCAGRSQCACSHVTRHDNFPFYRSTSGFADDRRMYPYAHACSVQRNNTTQHNAELATQSLRCVTATMMMLMIIMVMIAVGSEHYSVVQKSVVRFLNLFERIFYPTACADF